MKQEEEKYFSISDVINTALTNPESIKSKKTSSDNGDFSLNVISDLTYLNVWNSFLKWCNDQSELGNLIDIFSFGKMFYCSEKPNEGIIIKFSDLFLKEHNLKTDNKNSIYEKQYKVKFGNSQPQIEKLNLIAISNELNIKKILVQNGLNNLFNVIGYLLENNPKIQIDLGLLGIVHANNLNINHVPSKVKNESNTNKKTTIQSLMERIKKPENEKNENEENHEKFENNEEEALKLKNEIEQNLKNNNEQILEKKEYSLKELSEINKAKIVINNTIKKGFEEEKKIPKIYNIKNLNKSTELPPVKLLKGDRIINIPMPEERFNIKDMFHRQFRIIKIQKAKANPILFNVYSNTKAAPFTAEKTQIPITHRIASFYSLSIQNLIIDKTSKSIKRLYDDYFYKYNNIKFEEPATELEEYLYLLHYDNIDEEKIKLKKQAYNRYNNFIEKSINDDYISVMKSDWIVQIIKMINRFYLMKQYDVLVNDCFKEMTYDYKKAVKTSILDYILKHPEQRQKLNIPISFRRIKEYAEKKITRPSDNDLRWKNNFQKNKLIISNNLYIMSENATKIMSYFQKHLIQTSYINLNDFEGNHWPTLKLNKFIENQKNQLEEEKNLVNENWRKYVENTLKENKIYKDQLILYFKSIGGLMSSELRKLIINSIEEYSNFMKQYKKNEYISAEDIFKNQFNPNQDFQKSFIEVDLTENPNKTKYTFSDQLSDIHLQLTNVVKDIIKCSQGIERADNMFIKNIDKHSNLWQVPFIDSSVTEMYNELNFIINENLEVIDKVTDLYEPFEFVMKEDDEIQKFISSNPKRDDYKKKISFYEEKENLINTMPNYLYMNMIKINCTNLNEHIRSEINKFTLNLLNNILTVNIFNKSKYLGQSCTDILGELKTQISSEEILFKLENIAETCRSETIPQLLNEYEDFLEWVFFYLSYDTYPVYETQKEISNNLETTIKECHDNFIQIDISMKSFMDVLENQKKKFTIDLDEERAKLLDDITQLKLAVDDNKENIKTKLYGDENKFREGLEKLNQEALNCKERLRIVVEKEGYLGNPFTTEDERVDQCLNDLEPMIKYFSFMNKYKTIYKTKRENKLVDIDYNEMDELCEQFHIFDFAMQKITSYKDRIQRAKSDFESFKLTVELSKLILPLVSILQKNIIDDNPIFEDNKAYCIQLAKLLPNVFMKETEEETQSEMGNIIFIDIQKYAKNIEPYKLEVERIVSEWQNVSSMYDIQPKIVEDLEIDFHLEKYNKKEYLIIKHDSYNQVIDGLENNIKLINEKLDLFEEPKEDLIIYSEIIKLKEQMEKMLKTIKNLNECQSHLEGYMDKTTDIKKKSESFMILKSAEKHFKGLMDLLIQKKLKILTVYFENEKINSGIDDLSKLYRDLDKSLREVNV